jgi:YVTN family beta-propeller protein
MQSRVLSWKVLPLLALAATGVSRGDEAREAAERNRFTTPTRSTSIAITSDDRRVVVANQEADSVSVLEVKNRQGQDAFTLLAEIPGWKDPRSVAITPDDKEAWVSNAASSTVQVISLKTFQILATLPTGTEPRGVAITPNGKKVYVANLTSNTVTVIDAVKRKVLFQKPVGLNPVALAISNDGDGDDDDETVFVTRLFGKPDKGISSEVNDQGRAGFVYSFRVGDSTPTRADIKLSPLVDTGFTANRVAFCPKFNGALQSAIFCPDVNIADPASPVLTAVKQAAFPNQMASALIRGRALYLPNIGASPEPPISFNVNVQALVHVVDTVLLQELADKHVNLNAQIKLETQPIDPKSLARLFGGDLIDIDATGDGKTFLVLSRGGDYAMKATLVDGKLSLGAPAVVRFRTGHIPTGVVVSNNGKRAYTNNSLGYSISALDLSANKTIARDVQASQPPETGTPAHALSVGKLAFFSALGVPDDGLLETPIRQIDTLASRNKASDNAWSSCASCHFEGMSDSVTWSFATGPRRTIPLVGSFSKLSPSDQRIFNFSAVRGSVTDFNENSRAVQGGKGFAGDPQNPNVYNHGIVHGASEALDLMTLWVERIRPFRMPKPPAAGPGRAVFGAACASCHGGAKWTKSQVLYRENPAFDKDPVAAGGIPVDPGVLAAGPQVRQVTSDGKTLRFLEDIGSFDTNKAIEMRCCGGVAGTKALGVLGFNVPSLLNVVFHGPYLHDGSAETLDDLFLKHRLPGGQTIANSFSPTQLEQLRAFLISIDGQTKTFKSEADTYRDSIEAARQPRQ